MNRARSSALVDPSDQGPGWRDYTDVVKRQAPIILIAILVGGLIGAAFAANTPKRYKAIATVRLTATTSPFNASSGRTADLTRALLTEIQAAKGDSVENRFDNQGATLDAAPGAETDTILLSASASTRDTAADVANAYADAYLADRSDRIQQAVKQGKELAESRIAELNRQITEIGNDRTLDTATVTARRNALEQQIRDFQTKANGTEYDATINPTGAEMLSRATAPAGSSTIGLIPAGMVGAFVGLLLGLLLAGLIELASSRVRSAVRARRLVPGTTVFDVQPTRHSSVTPDLRVLAASLRPGTINGSNLAVALPADRSTPAQETVATLAVMLARSGVSTALVDATTTSQGPGLYELLEGNRTLHEVVRTSDSMPLSFVTAGNVPKGRVEFDGDRLATAMYELAKQARAVLVLLPPPLESTMTATVARAADDVLVFFSSGSRKSDVSGTVEVLNALGASVSAGVFVGRAAPVNDSDAVLDSTQSAQHADPAHTAG